MTDQEQQEATQEAEVVDLPDVRVGQTWESMDPREDWQRRRVKVLMPPDGDGQVLVENMRTGRHSHISRERFVPPHWEFKS